MYNVFDDKINKYRKTLSLYYRLPLLKITTTKKTTKKQTNKQKSKDTTKKQQKTKNKKQKQSKTQI